MGHCGEVWRVSEECNISKWNSKSKLTVFDKKRLYIRVQSILPATSTTFCQGLETTFRAHMYPACKQTPSKIIAMTHWTLKWGMPRPRRSFQLVNIHLELRLISFFFHYNPVDNAYHRETFNRYKSLFEKRKFKTLSVGTPRRHKLQGSAWNEPIFW